MKLKRALKRMILRCVNVLAMLMVVQTANSTCVWVVHQPEFPTEANKLKKIS